MTKNSNIQIIAYTAPDSKPSCNRCGSKNLKSGAGLKPGQESWRCLNCGEFLGYSPIKRVEKLKKRKKLTDCLNLLESRGIRSEEAQIFTLSEIGAMGGEV